jgi:pilus assembly protein Flp/PilA
MSFLKKLSANKRGATAIEYALIAGLVAVAAVSILGSVGLKVTGKFEDVNNDLSAAAVEKP